MSHHRFTLKELQELSDVQFLSILLNEREGDCTNIYAPLTKRIRATRLRLEQGNLLGQPKATPIKEPKVNLRLSLTKRQLDNTNGSGGLEITIRDCVGNPQEKEPGTAIFLEYYKGQYQVHVWDGTQQDPITIKFKKRPRK